MNEHNKELDGKWVSFKDESKKHRTEVDDMGLRDALVEVKEAAKLTERMESTERDTTTLTNRKVDKRLLNLEHGVKHQQQKSGKQHTARLEATIREHDDEIAIIDVRLDIQDNTQEVSRQS